MDVEIHPNAKKHLTEKQVLSAWLAVTECIRRESKDEPPRWLAIGWPQTDEAWSLSRSRCPWVAYHSCLVSSPEEILAGD